MAVTIRHLRSQDGENKTLCGRPITYRTNLTEAGSVDSFHPRIDRLCARCQTKAERLGLIRPAGVREDGTVDHESVTSGDKNHDEWLARLGICERP